MRKHYTTRRRSLLLLRFWGLPVPTAIDLGGSWFYDYRLGWLLWGTTRYRLACIIRLTVSMLYMKKISIMSQVKHSFSSSIYTLLPHFCEDKSCRLRTRHGSQYRVSLTGLASSKARHPMRIPGTIEPTASLNGLVNNDQHTQLASHTTHMTCKFPPNS